MTDRPTVRPPLPGPPADRPAAPTVTLAARAPSAVHTAEPASVAFPLVAAVARGVALVFVLPVRLLWELIAAAGRLLYRHLLSPTGRFLRDWLVAPLVWGLHRLLWRPLVWCAHNLIWLPLTWVARNLLWLPLVWLGRGVAWVARTLVWLPLVWLGRALAWVARTVVWSPLVWLARRGLRPPLVALGRVLVWLTEHLVLRPLRWVGAALTPAGRLLWRGVGMLAGALGAALAGLVRGIRWVVVGFGRLIVVVVVGAWRTAGWVLRLVYRLVLRPIGHGLRWWWHTVRPLLLVVRWVWSVTVVPVARGLRTVWRATVTPAARWTRRAVLDPARVASREVLSALGLRR
ncbi:hypothetical protein [Micromonospora taraxaci]|uniref:hypothetical protein n=1 Tax=Micromonospora taraxaci TaxID=1316803 RepID=UPI00339EDC6F